MSATARARRTTAAIESGVTLSTRRGRAFWLAGATLVGLFAALTALSHQFAYGRGTLDKPILTLVTLLGVAGSVYLAAIWCARPWLAGGPPRVWWLGMLGVGLAMRAVMFGATPILEDDYYRYLWDGAIVAHGHDPYAHSPQQVRRGETSATLQQLVEASGPVVERINHPRLRTIYPPAAQGAFAAAHLVAPWDINGLRVVWLVFDALTMGLLVLLLKDLALPAAAVVIYWWNPLLVQQVYGSGHMDIVVLPLVIGALLLFVRRRVTRGSIVLALATGAKLWPALLMALPLRRAWPSGRRLVGVAVAFAMPALMLLAPVWLAGLDDASGFTAYGKRWQMNDSLFVGFYQAARLISQVHAQTIARGLTATLVLGWMAWLCRKPAPHGRALCERALWIIAALFLLSPTQFPWYWLWLLPLLAVRPSPGLLVLTVTLPLYYLRFRFAALGQVAWFDYGIVWLEFLPAWILLAWEAWRHRRVDSPRVTDERVVYER